MNPSRRIGISHLLALGFLAGAVAACGVRGDPEFPQSQALTAQPQPAAPGTQRKVFTEESVVRRGAGTPEMAPVMPPREWEKYGKDYQPAATSKKSREAEQPDRPFILDSLL